MRHLNIFFFASILFTPNALFSSNFEGIQKNIVQYAQKEAFPIITDSLCRQYIVEAEKTSNLDDITQSYLYFLQYSNHHKNANKESNLVNEAMLVADKSKGSFIGNELTLALSNYFVQENNKEEAYNYLHQLETNALTKSQLVYYNIIYGKILELEKKSAEACTKFQLAIYDSKKYHCDSLYIISLQQQFLFYYKLQLYEKAKEYNRLKFEAIDNRIAEDSFLYYETLYEKAMLFNKTNQLDLGEQLTFSVIDFANKTHNEKLKEYALSNYRSALLNNNNFEKIAQLYSGKFLPELLLLESKDSLLYNRIQAFIKEYEQKYDSAEIYNRRAEDLLFYNKNPSLKATFYQRFAQYYERRNNTNKQIVYWEKSLEFSEKADNSLLVLECCYALDNLYKKTDNASARIQILEKTTHYQKINFDQVSADNLTRIEIENVQKRYKLQEEQEENRREKKYQLQMLGIVFAILLIFLVLIALSNYKASPWIIKGIGFFSFILLFEFIIFIFDTKIHHATHGEPWKVVSLKIILIAILSPLHHYLEHVVIHYLQHNNFVSLLRQKLKILKDQIIEKITS